MLLPLSRELLGRKRRNRRRRKKNLLSIEDWLQKIAILEREWKESSRYGAKVEKIARELFGNKPIGVTECFLSSTKYLFKFNKAKERR